MVWFSCKCHERKKPVKERNWFVTQRNSRCSAFDGYHTRSSDFSTIRCFSCRATGRTNAKFVIDLKDAPPGWHRNA